MTFDDGILTIYSVKNIANPGKKPIVGIQKKEEYHYQEETLGIQRKYLAMQAGQTLEAVVNIPGWEEIEGTDICILENERQYKIQLAQRTYDGDGLKITKLSLERNDEEYVLEEVKDH